jgi:uncharacterized protein YbjT (DUF2867 family)
MAFARYKGEAEKALLALGFPRVYILRPAYIYPVEPRKEPNLSYRLLRAIYPAFRVLFPNQVIPADELGRAMVDVAVGGTGEPGGQILENRDIRAMVKLPRPPNRRTLAGVGGSDLSCNMLPSFCTTVPSGVLADPILTAVHDDRLTGDEGGIVAC